MVGNPETPSISPDTPDLEHSGESSGYRPENYGLGSPDTSGINPDTPEIPDIRGFSPDIPGFAEVWASGCLG